MAHLLSTELDHFECEWIDAGGAFIDFKKAGRIRDSSDVEKYVVHYPALAVSEKIGGSLIFDGTGSL